MLRDDFRRTAVRSLFNAGVSERVAMMITVHKTRSIVDRYAIAGPVGLQESTEKLAGKPSDISWALLLLPLIQ